jgi:alpha-L-arabinofuranosidase
MTLESALLNARLLNVFLRHCDKVEIATRSNMANSFCGATFETNPSGVLRRPCHFLMEMYRRHALPIPLKVDDAPKGLDIFACASADGKSVTVFAINSKRRARSVEPAMPGLRQASPHHKDGIVARHAGRAGSRRHESLERSQSSENDSAGDIRRRPRFAGVFGHGHRVQIQVAPEGPIGLLGRMEN